MEAERNALLFSVLNNSPRSVARGNRGGLVHAGEELGDETT